MPALPNLSARVALCPRALDLVVAGRRPSFGRSVSARSCRRSWSTCAPAAARTRPARAAAVPGEKNGLARLPSAAPLLAGMKIVVLLGMSAAVSSAFQLSTHSHKQRRALRPALFARDTTCLFNCPEWNLTKWVDDRSRNFWQTSDGTLDTTGEGDAGIRDATLIAAAVDRGARQLAASVDGGAASVGGVAAAVDRGARQLTSVALVISMGLPGATCVWPQACLLAMMWKREVLRCWNGLVFMFRHTARSIGPSSPSLPPPSPPPLCDPPTTPSPPPATNLWCGVWW